MVESYESALRAARKVGASRADDAGVMAMFCASALPLLCGAVSPKLVWEVAQRLDLTALELARIAADEPEAVAALMWS